MTRQEFLHELQIALRGEMSREAVDRHVKYYGSYIMEESRKGSSEEEVIARLGVPCELVTMKTTGDKILDRTLDKVGGKGLFVRELDCALAEGRIEVRGMRLSCRRASGS